MRKTARRSEFDAQYSTKSWTRVVIPLLLIPIFFGLGILFYSKYPNTMSITGENVASTYNNQPRNNVDNYNGRTLNNTSYTQGSQPQVGIGGGAPTPVPSSKALNYCPKK